MTLREHHSFVELPDASYKPRVVDPRAGASAYLLRLRVADHEPISKRFVRRIASRRRIRRRRERAGQADRLLPRSAARPSRSAAALLEGARWWNQAFEAAGFRNAFQVELLPDGADPMDVRYNMINWVHRSTRGWCYGGSVSDPRTGEIIKGRHARLAARPAGLPDRRGPAVALQDRRRDAADPASRWCWRGCASSPRTRSATRSASTTTTTTARRAGSR